MSSPAAPLPTAQANISEKKGRVANGMEVPFFQSGDRSPQITSAKDMNLLVSILRSLTNPKIVQGDVWDIRLTDSGMTVQVGNPPISGGSGSGGSLQPFRLKSVQGDYVTARTWDGSSDGPTDIHIAKEFWLRNSVTSATPIIGGPTHTYSYSAGPDTNNIYRTHSDGTNSQVELVTPIWTVNEIIYASNCNTLVNDGGGNPITWLLQRTSEWGKVSPIAVAPTTIVNSTDSTSGYTGGLMVADNSFIYVSVGSNSWKRVAIASW